MSRIGAFFNSISIAPGNAAERSTPARPDRPVQTEKQAAEANKEVLIQKGIGIPFDSRGGSAFEALSEQFQLFQTLGVMPKSNEGDDNFDLSAAAILEHAEAKCLPYSRSNLNADDHLMRSYVEATGLNVQFVQNGKVQAMAVSEEILGKPAVTLVRREGDGGKSICHPTLSIASQQQLELLKIQLRLAGNQELKKAEARVLNKSRPPVARIVSRELPTKKLDCVNPPNSGPVKSLVKAEAKPEVKPRITRF